MGMTEMLPSVKTTMKAIEAQTAEEQLRHQFRLPNEEKILGGEWLRLTIFRL